MSCGCLVCSVPFDWCSLFSCMSTMWTARRKESFWQAHASYSKKYYYYRIERPVRSREVSMLSFHFNIHYKITKLILLTVINNKAISTVTVQYHTSQNEQSQCCIKTVIILNFTLLVCFHGILGEYSWAMVSILARWEAVK